MIASALGALVWGFALYGCVQAFSGTGAIDANGNPLTPKTYGFAAGRP